MDSEPETHRDISERVLPDGGGLGSTDVWSSWSLIHDTSHRFLPSKVVPARHSLFLIISFRRVQYRVTTYV